MGRYDWVAWAISGLILFGVPIYIVVIATGFAINVRDWF